MNREQPRNRGASISRRTIKDRCRLLLAQIEFQRAAECRNALIASHARRDGDREVLATCMARQEERVRQRQDAAWAELCRAERRCGVLTSHHVDLWGFAERMDRQLGHVALNRWLRRAPRSSAG